MQKPDKRIPDNAWPPTYRIKATEWKKLKKTAKPTSISEKHRAAISAVIGAYRYKSLAYPEGHVPRHLQRNLKSLQGHLAKAIEKLDDGDVAQTLGVVERSYANLYSLPVGLHSTPSVELRLPELIRATTTLRQLTEHAIRLRMFDKRRGFGRTTELKEKVRIPTSYDPPLEELVRGLVRYWGDEIRGSLANSIDVTQDPPRGSPLTQFVHYCLDIARARDRKGKPFNLINVRQMLKRIYRKPGVGRANSPTKVAGAKRQGTRSAEKRRLRS